MILEQPYLLIAISSLVIGLIAGLVMHRSDFCITSCFRDAILFRDFFLMRQLLLVIVASMALFELGRLAGVITLYPFPLLGLPSLANALGGCVFGIGMVLAGGCVCGSLYKLGAAIESLFAPEHVAGLAYFSLQPLNYTPPFADRPITGGPGPGWDAIAAIQYPLLLGIVGGAFFSAMRLGEWRPRWRLPPRQFASALLGGLLLGLAARMTPSWQYLAPVGGVPILAMQSLLFLAGLLPGTWVGARLLTRFVVR